MDLNFNHVSVLPKETIEALDIKPNGIYVDGTAGGGGTASKILEKLSTEGKLICVDQDPDAIKFCKKKFENFKNVSVLEGNFVDIKKILKCLHIEEIDGAILDLGVSSYQLDTAERGFSYKLDAPLDMRMNKSGKSAFDLVNYEKEFEITRIFRDYGEEKFAKRIAKEIIFRREKGNIETTLQLAEIIKNSIPQFARRNKHPAKKSFQALRIAVNDELNILKKALENLFEILKPNGRMAVITFHSLEDRLVKTKMNSWTKGCVCPGDFPVCVCKNNPNAKILGKIKPTKSEIEKNFRSRSAKLRVCEKL